MSASADGPTPGSPAGPGGPKPAPVRTGSPLRRADLVAALLVLVVATVTYLILQGGVGGPTPPTVALAPGAARRLMAERPRVSMPATLDLLGTSPDEAVTLTEGAAISLSFRVEGNARPLVLEERSDHVIALLFPPPGRPSEVVPAGRRVTIEDPRGGTYVVHEPAGPRRVRLVVFPPDVDPFTIQPTELSRLVSRLTIVERRYFASPREGTGE